MRVLLGFCFGRATSAMDDDANQDFGLGQFKWFTAI